MKRVCREEIKERKNMVSRSRLRPFDKLRATAGQGARNDAKNIRQDQQD